MYHKLCDIRFIILIYKYSTQYGKRIEKSNKGTTYLYNILLVRSSQTREVNSEPNNKSFRISDKRYKKNNLKLLVAFYIR